MWGVKKTLESTQNDLVIINTKRYELITQIQKFLAESCSQREITRRLGISSRTVWKYKYGDPGELLKTGIRIGKMDNYIDEILNCLNDRNTKKETLQILMNLGYTSSLSNAYEYFQKVEQAVGMEFESHPYVHTKTKTLNYRAGSTGKDYDFIRRTGILQFLWPSRDLERDKQAYIFEKYPMLYDIKKCVQDFRQIFKAGSMPLLYLYIDKYTKSSIPSIKSFTSGIQRDIEAVENSVASDLSNGFVEGINSKLKMIKRTMYARCNIQLLRTKLMLNKSGKNG